MSAPFKGTFDGNGHKITKLKINRPTEDEIGLFGATNGAIIKNLGIEDCDITGNDGVGGLAAGFVDSSIIENCYVTGKVTGNGTVGGLVGYNGYYSSIENCYVTGNVTGNEAVGGLVGLNDYSFISNCYATGIVTGYEAVGGLVGLNYGSFIENCYATANVEGKYGVGGLVGNNYFSSIENCYATGSVNGNDGVGGLVGVNDDDSSISNCVAANTSVTGNTDVNRILGVDYSGGDTFTNNHSLKTMLINGSTVSSTDADSPEGKDATLATLQSLVFYKTTLTWDIAANNSETWKICDGYELFPFLTWENKSCSGEGIEAPPSPPEGGDVRVYPNPTRGELIIEMGDMGYGICDIEIFDIMGKKVSHLTISHPISISHLPAGMYFLRIQTENGMITKKIIKN
jgi:hypothetical protein